jgi:pyridoxal/pyridoxine/pyridoxamine kinase
MDILLWTILGVLVLSNAWTYGIARDAIDTTEVFRLRMEGLQQRYNGIEYKLMLVEQRLSKKKK